MDEGSKIKFETNGIERATSNYNASQGGCNEIIGMIYRDGSLTPYFPVETNISTNMWMDRIFVTFLGMWVHKTTSQNNYIIIYKHPTQEIYYLDWKNEEDVKSNTGSWTRIARFDSVVTKIDFVGNMIVVNGTVYLFRNGSYSAGFDINNINFRMNLGAQGNGVAVMYDGVSFSYTDNTSLASNLPKLYEKTFGADKTYEQINANFKILESEAKRGEYITGACFLRYAIRLYDGSYVGVSKPVLVMPDTYYKNIRGEKYDANENPKYFSYNSNQIKFAIKTNNNIPAPCPGLRHQPQLGLIQSFFGSTMFWNYISMCDEGGYVDNIAAIMAWINNAIVGNGLITDTIDSVSYNIKNYYLYRKNYPSPADVFQKLNLDYWLLSKGKVGFREIFQFNNADFDKDKYYRLDNNESLGQRLKYFDITSTTASLRRLERCKGWTWGAIPYFVPRVYQSSSNQNTTFDDSNMAMIIAATLNPYFAGHDNTVNGYTDSQTSVAYAALLNWMKKTNVRDPWNNLAPIVSADGLDSTPSWFTTRYRDGKYDTHTHDDIYVPFGEDACDGHNLFSASNKGAVFAPLNEHIGELGFGAFNTQCFEGAAADSTTNNVSMVFGRELYSPVYEILEANNIPSELVSSIDIFMTPPVSMHEDYNVNAMRFDTMAAHRPYRKKSDVAEDLKKTLGQFHKIHSIPIEEIQTSDPIFGVVPEHPINKVMMPYIERGRISNIEQQPLLEWNGDNKSEYKVSYVYNNKLHIAQITDIINEELYDDCNDELSHNNDPRYASWQEPFDMVTQSQRHAIDRHDHCESLLTMHDTNLLTALNANIQGTQFSQLPEILLVYLIDIKIDNVDTTIVLKKRVTLNRDYPQNIGFFYPNSDTKKATLIGFLAREIDAAGNVSFEYFYPIEDVIHNLEQDKTNMISYKFDISDVYDYLTVAKINGYLPIEDPTQFPFREYEANNRFTRDVNIFKVSETNQPLVFPYINTYRVGYGKIIAFSSYTTALSQGQFGEYPLLVFTTEGIFAMKTDTSGIGTYLSNAPLSREVCTNANTIVQVDGGVFFGTAKGLMFVSGSEVMKWSEMLNGKPRPLPAASSAGTGDGLFVYALAMSHASITPLHNSISRIDFVEYLNYEDTRISYLYELNKLLVYNKEYSYSYLIDIDKDGKCTKLAISFKYDNGDYPECLVNDGVRLRKFTKTGGYTTASGDPAIVDCLIQTRPILLNTESKKSNYRVVLRGLFNHAQISTPTLNTFAGIYVLGSLDGERWMYIGGSEYPHTTMPLVNDIGTTIERMSIKYIMIIYASKNRCEDTKIDNFEISTTEKYNDKTR